MVVDPVLLGLAFSAGVATFFSPCSVGLVPAYLAYYVGLDEGVDDDPVCALRAGGRFGGAAAAGILAVAAGAGLAVHLLTGTVGVSTARLGDGIWALGVVVGVLLVGLGALMVAGRGGWTLPVRPPKAKTVAGMAGFGAVFALASIGCTLPVFVAILTQALVAGPVGGLVTFVVYGMGLASLMLAISIALSLARDRVQALLDRVLPHVKTVAGLALAVAGLYTLYVYLWLVPPWA